ncbi:MAG: hypothetical protein RL660_860 [Bacteroidota bacterium]|jgi:hypothetical protein
MLKLIFAKLSFSAFLQWCYVSLMLFFLEMQANGQSISASLSMPIVGVFGNKEFENTLNAQTLYIPCISAEWQNKGRNVLGINFLHYSFDTPRFNFHQTGQGLESKTGYFLSLCVGRSILPKTAKTILQIEGGISFKLIDDARWLRDSNITWHSIQDERAAHHSFGGIILGSTIKYPLYGSLCARGKVSLVCFLHGNNYQRNTIFGEYGISFRF